MMEHYVTLFDLGFAPQGIALHRSLQRHAGKHTLWVLCIDEAVEQLLDELDLPDVRTIRLDDIETDPLRSVRPTRTRAEYCWTLTPFTHDIVFDRAPDARRVTYIDADVWLREDPQPVFSDFDRSGAAVQITEHAYAPEYDQTAKSGKYCVQFLTMDRHSSEPVRRWWQERCLEWCFARFEDGKCGDQKYLDDWPTRFSELVHVATPQSRFQGPWNAIRFPFSEGIAYHFHGLRITGRDSVAAFYRYRIPRPHWESVYEPYLMDLAAALGRIHAATGASGEIQTVSRAGGTERLIKALVAALLNSFRSFILRSRAHSGKIKLPRL